MSEITLGTATADNWDEIHEMFSAALNFDVDPAGSAADRQLFEPDRTLVARRDGRIVGTIGAVTRRLAIPGGVVAAAHSGRGAVSSTARRQGVLTRLLHRHMADARALGEAVSVCWASEGRIYQRYGYALAVRRVGLAIDTREVVVPVAGGDGALTDGTPAELRDVLVKTYDEVYTQRPGWSERAAKHWDRLLADPPHMRGGATALRALIHEGPDGVDGYALWRATGEWTDSGPAGEVRVEELVATTTAAYTDLWRFLTTVDLTRTTRIWSCAVDEPLFYWVGEPRRMAARVSDGLWARVLNVPKALAERRYAAPVDLVIEVADAVLPENTGRWRLTGSPEAASCDSTTAVPDLVCDIRALSAAYLGGASMTSLAAAGLVTEHTPGSLAAATTAFTWPQPASAFEIF